MSEEEKMKLRYLREQKERAKQSLLGNVPQTKNRRKNKFNLNSDDESDEQDMMIGFTHKGRKLGEFEDDFKEQIELSSDDEAAGRDKGKLTEEMVNVMNFGGGENPESVSGKACLNFCRRCPCAKKQGRKFSMKLSKSQKHGMLPEKRSKRSTMSSKTSWTMNIKTLLVFLISKGKSSMMSQLRKKLTRYRMKRLRIVLERLSRLLRSSRNPR
jgi:hypothetical protein